ncbi:Cyclic di-GMP phosphodiesterase Gmr [Croceibacterium atlanticum]|uniref:Cyclic di-GMP phosphodiesterase Gmr n=2 Tax=Croceibacterium atlanticum TaxID=1267766 RepID=A0A0F7KNN9_9SPHN|nr:diguanylate cyclase [Croceibacterium atlanticum]AKH42128.1 Cyclic di-GMP phosphodiesterase Gmr [Croceibacterium atlanticum]
MIMRAGGGFERRFRMRVLLPGGLVLLATSVLCGAALIAAGRSADSLSAMAQQAEVWKATSEAMDELALAQESVGMCEECIEEAASADPDGAWLDKNIGEPLFDLYDAHATYILDPDDRPVYASVQRQRLAPAAFDQVAPALQRFVQLARGEIQRPSGQSNLSERLPGSPPAPLVLAPMPGLWDEPVTAYPSVRTTPNVVHSTDLVRIGDRIAVVSVMQMARSSQGEPQAAEQPPVLVNLRYLDDEFLREAAQRNYLLDARISDSPTPLDGESSAALTNSDSVRLAYFFWKPQPSGALVIKGLLLPAAGAFAVIATLVLLMALGMRILMKRDDEHLSQLEEAHVELRAKEAQAHHLAYHDALTGLPNRALFNDRVEQALIKSRHGDAVAILLLDLDRFKHVNDRFGHLVGDELIREVGMRLLRVFPASKSVARLGGDEFAILIEKDDLSHGIEDTLERIVEDVQRPYEVLGNQVHVGVSIGIVIAPEYGSDRTELMRKADIALYRAKAEGRNCYRFFDQSMDETVQLRATIESDLRNAICSGTELSIHYQPLVDSISGEVRRFSAGATRNWGGYRRSNSYRWRKRRA